MSTLDAAIDLFRRARQERFRAECIIKRTTADGVFDPVTGTIGAPTKETIYEGACNVRGLSNASGQGSDVAVGDREIRLSDLVLVLPSDVAVREDDRVTITSAVYDASLVGPEFRIADTLLDSWQITRRAIIERVAREPE